MKKKVKKKGSPNKGRLNIILDDALKLWVHNYARKNHTTVTNVIIEHFVSLRDRERGIDVEQI